MVGTGGRSLGNGDEIARGRRPACGVGAVFKLNRTPANWMRYRWKKRRSQNYRAPQLSVDAVANTLAGWSRETLLTMAERARAASIPDPPSEWQMK